jgi:hypothetical protein
VNEVHWKPLVRIAAIVLMTGAVAGCGGAALLETNAAPKSSNPAIAPGSDPTASVRYCQRLEDGKWVTNDSASSTTPCVPDPAYAARYEEAAESIAVPRCFTCKLSDWERADRRITQSGTSSPASSVAAYTTPIASGLDRWPRSVRDGFINNCAAYMVGSMCVCLANHLGWQVAPREAETLSGDDPRVQVAAEECRQ